MAYPPQIPTRVVSIGGAMVLESSNLLRIAVEIRSSRSLIWDATGYRFEKHSVTQVSEPGSELVFTLPRTDVPGWRDALSGSLIDVSAPESYTHRYTATVAFQDTNGRTVPGGYTVGPFVIPEGVGVIDLDKTVPASSIAGDVINVPDLWGYLVEQAQASAASAAQSAVEAAENGASDEVVAAYITAPGSESATAVGTIVTGAIASDGTVLDAAEAAVGDAVAGLAVMQYVFFGSDVSTPRPPGDGPKVWVGQGEPVNALVYDLVVESTYSPPPAHLPPAHSYLGAGLSASQWSDGVGAAHLTQPTAERQPEVVQVNGTNVARLRGGTNGDVPPGSGFDAAALAGLFRNKPGGTVMALFRKSGAQTAATRALFNFSLGSSGSNGRIQVAHTTAQRFQMLTRRLDGDAQASVTHSATVTDGAWALVVAEANWAAGTFRLRVNGVDATGTYAGAGNSSDTAALRGVVGGRSGSTPSPTVTDVLAGDLAAVLVWDSVLDGDDFTHWEGVLNTLKTTLGG